MPSFVLLDQNTTYIYIYIYIYIWVYHSQGSTAIFRQFSDNALDVPHPKCLFSDVTSLMSAVMSYVMSQHCMCIGHMTFYYKRSADALVGGSSLWFIHSSGSPLSPETHVWLVPNACRLRCV